MMYDIDMAMNIIDQVGPELYYDMIGGPQNAAWAEMLSDDEGHFDYWMSDEDDDDEFFDFDEMEKKTFVTLQDSSVIQHLSFYQQNSAMFRLPKNFPHIDECYEDLYRLLEEVELMVRTWRRRCDHAYTAHLRNDPTATQTESDQLLNGEDYSQSDYEFDEDIDEVVLSARVPIVPNENLTRKKFCQSVKVYQKMFCSDKQFQDFQHMILKMKKYVFRTIIQIFMGTIPADTANRLPQELWEKIWKYTQNGYFRYKDKVPLNADKTYYKAGQRVNKATLPTLWKVEQARLSDLFGAVGNLHITLFEILFQSTPNKDSFGLVDEWETNDSTSMDSYKRYKTMWSRHYAMVVQKFARLRQVDGYLISLDSGSSACGSDLPGLTMFQKVERGIFTIDEVDTDHESMELDNTVRESGSDFYSQQQCKYFGCVGFEPPLEASASEEYSMNVKLYNATTGKINYRIITDLKYSLFKLELAKFAPQRIGKTNWRRSVCLTETRMSVMYCDTTFTKMQVKIWSTSIDSNETTGLDSETEKTESEQIIRLTAPIIDDVIAINEDIEENTPPPPQNKKSTVDDETKKTRELNKKDLKARVFHSQNRVVVSLQNPYKTRTTVMAVYCATTGEKYLDLNWPDEDLSLVGFKDNLALLINHTASKIILLNTECGEPVLSLDISELNKCSASYGSWVGLFDSSPSISQFVLLRSDNSEFQLFKYDPSKEMSKPVMIKNGQIADKMLLSQDVLNCALLKDGSLYFNKKSLVLMADDCPVDFNNEIKSHEIGCYNFVNQTYMPIIFMYNHSMESSDLKYSEVSLQFRDTLLPAKSFPERRPLFCVDDLRLAQIDDALRFTDKFGPRVKVVSFEKDEVECVAHEVKQEDQKEQAIERMKVKMEEQKLENERKQKEVAARNRQEKQEALHTIVGKEVSVEGVVFDWRGTYGFIKSEGIAGSLGRIFFHRSNVRTSNKKLNVNSGTRLKYTINPGRDPGSFQAFNIEILSMNASRSAQQPGSRPDPRDVDLLVAAVPVPVNMALTALNNTQNDLVAAMILLSGGDASGMLHQ